MSGGRGVGSPAVTKQRESEREFRLNKIAVDSETDDGRRATNCQHQGAQLGEQEDPVDGVGAGSGTKPLRGILKMPQDWNSRSGKEKKITFGVREPDLSDEINEVREERMRKLERGWELWCLKLEQCEVEELLFVTLRVNGLLVKAMVDSGATISIVRMDQYNKMARKPPLQTLEVGTRLGGLGSSGIKVEGYFMAEWECGGCSRTVGTLVVSGLDFQAVMGLTVMKAMRAYVKPWRLTMKIEGVRKPIRLTTEAGRTHLVNYVWIEKEVVIPPHVKHYKIGVKSWLKGKGDALLTEGIELPYEHIRVQRGLMDMPSFRCRNGPTNLSLRVMNLGDKAVTIHPGHEVATITPCQVEDVSAWIAKMKADNPVKGEDELGGETGIDGLDLTTNTVLTDLELRGLTRYLQPRRAQFLSKGMLPGKARVTPHRIDTGKSHPVRARYGRQARKEHDIVEVEVLKLWEAKMISPSASEWCAPVVLIKKKDGTPRFCIDYRRLNDVTVKDSYPLPRIDDALDLLGKSLYLSTLDFATGYYQVPLAEEDRKKTAFTTRSGVYEWNVMPMGLCNAPATFQRVMDVLLTGMSWEMCLCYIDDIIVFSPTFEQHLLDLDRVFNKLEEVGLKLRAEKCAFCKKELLYLGFVLTRDGVHTNPKLISAVVECEAPKDVKGVQRFIGLTGYYRRFVDKFSHIAHPLIRLMREDVEFEWTPECQVAFEELKKRLVTAPILVYPDFEKGFKLEVDASAVGLGGVLSQKGDDGHDHVVAYWSSAVPRRQRHFTSTELECMAIHHGIKHFRPYLWGRKFEIVTDHNSLKWLMNLKNPTPKLQRWSLDLTEYEFSITHRPGRVHNNADALSRPPVIQLNVAGVRRLEQETASGIEEAQKRDYEIGPLYDYVANGELPVKRALALQVIVHCQKLYLDEGLLFRRYEVTTPRVAPTVWKQLVLPATYRRAAMEACHDGYMGGHLGEVKTTLKVKQRFWWPKMCSQVEQWVKTCPSCNTKRNPRQRLQGLLIPTVFSYPWEQVAIDILGPLKESQHGHRYVLVVTDAFSKWAETKALKTQAMVEIAEFLVKEVFCRYGCPKRLLSDRGGNFLSALASEIFLALEIRKLSTSSYHPQTDAITERFNATLCGMLSHYVNEDHTDWDDFLSFLTFAYNSAIHATTRYSPAYLLFGREPMLPVDVALGTRRDEPLPHFSYVRQMMRRMTEAHQLVRQSLELSAQKSALRYDLTRRESSVDVGDLVWRSVPYVPEGLSKKFFHQWYGPLRVIDRGTNNTCLLRDRATRKIHPVRVHVEKLKPFNGDWEDPNQFREEYTPWDERTPPGEAAAPEEGEADANETVDEETADSPLERRALEEEGMSDDDEEPQWRVAALVQPVMEKGERKYWVKWTGYKDLTLEPRRSLIQDCPQKVMVFEKKHHVRFTKRGVFWNK